MAFDETLAGRLRPLVASANGVVEKRMFGGLAFLINGNMAVGVHGPDLMVRLDPARATAAMAKPGVSAFPPGRPMRGWLLVDATVLDKSAALYEWVKSAVAYARTLPAK